MDKPVRRLLYWTPRVICILFAAFISLFAADVFSESRGIGQIVLALLMHLIPTFVMVAVLIVTWRREWIGGILFIDLGALYVVCAWNKPFASSPVLLAMAGPPVLIGARGRPPITSSVAA